MVTGREHTCALFSSGGVRCWGAFANGKLGDPTLWENIGDDESPSGLDDIALGGAAMQLSAGRDHTCALLDGGAVRCWGAGNMGQLGTGTSADIGDDEPPSSGAVAFSPGVVAVAISAGAFHTCALLDNGGVRCWGDGTSGKLGYGSTAPKLAPDASDVNLGLPALQVAAGGNHTCALLQGGSVRCWGEAGLGQLGYGSQSDMLSPGANVATGGAVSQLALGSAHTCALYTSGGVRCWGQGTEGVLLQPSVIPSKWGGYFGDEPAKPNDNPPKPAETPDQLLDIALGTSATPVQVVAGDLHNCVRFASGSVRCWGLGSEGALGYGTQLNVGNTGNPNLTMDVPLGGPASSLSAGSHGTCALLVGGAVRCWGENSAGQRGYGVSTGGFDDIGDDETPATMGDVQL